MYLVNDLGVLTTFSNKCIMTTLKIFFAVIPEYCLVQLKLLHGIPWNM